MTFRPTLEGKFIALASAIILVCSFVANISIVNVYRNQLFREAEQRAHLLTESTAISFTNALLYQELGLVEEGGLIENHIHDLLADSLTSVVGVTVYDPTGHILATNNYDDYLTRAPASADVLNWRDIPHGAVQKEAGGDRFSIIFPLRISTKSFGTLVVQFSRQQEHGQLADYKRMVFAMSLGFAVFGILMAFLVARTLASPIKTLAGEIEKVEDPTYEVALPATRMDEIGDLERGFVEMLKRLKSAAEEKDRQQKTLIQTEKLASVGTLVSGLAHEINNPLAGIRNCLRRIKDTPEDAVQTTRYAKLMDNALLRIENIIRDLLNFSRKKDISLQPVVLNDIIKAACHLVELRLKKHSVRLNMVLSDQLPPVLGDAQHLEQVFINLLLNAVDASEEGALVEISSGRDGRQAFVEVRDSGRGIPPEAQKAIFDPFFTTKPVGQGTGLGLAVSKAIIDEHEAQIDFTSSDDGTTFRVVFRLTGKQEGEHRPSLSAAILAGGKSSRMGRNKALVEVDGKPMIAHVADTIGKHIDNIVVIGSPSEDYNFLQLPVVADAVESCGPLAGIFTAVQQTSAQYCLVVACDLPFLSEALVKFLSENCRGYDILAFESDSGVEPLCAIYSKKCLPAIEAQLKNKRHKVSALFDLVNTRIVRMEPGLAFYDRRAFLNVNTPGELSEARSLRQAEPEIAADEKRSDESA